MKYAKKPQTLRIKQSFIQKNRSFIAVGALNFPGFDLR